MTSSGWDTVADEILVWRQAHFNRLSLSGLGTLRTLTLLTCTSIMQRVGTYGRSPSMGTSCRDAFSLYPLKMGTNPNRTFPPLVTDMVVSGER